MWLKICDIGYHHPFTGWLSYLMVIGIILHLTNIIYCKSKNLLCPKDTMPCQIIWSTTHITNHRIIYVSYRNNDLRGIAFTKYNYIEYAWWRLSPITPTKINESKWHDIIWSTTRHDQSSYQIWKLSDQRPERNCIHKVKQDRQTKKLYAPILSLYAGPKKSKLDSRLCPS
jgi:hypothetical protein